MTRRVILLHGIWMVGATMRWLAGRLREEGFAPEIFGYHSILGGPQAAIPELVARLAQDGPAHLVGHSLGGLIAVRALAEHPDLPVARTVCLGSPLCGSGAAASLARFSLLPLYMGRSAGALLDGCAQWPGRFEVGMIAGRVPRGLGGLLAHFEEAHDGTVAVSETRPPGLRDHLVVDASHTGLLFSREVSDQTIAFLRAGRFAPQD